MKPDALQKEYKKTHWGEEGDIEPMALECADPRDGVVMLGEVVSIVYRTSKAGEGLVDYEHDFGPGELPILGYVVGKRRNQLVICGGEYTVKEGGITG
jgi:hypothetical protein